MPNSSANGDHHQWSYPAGTRRLNFGRERERHGTRAEAKLCHYVPPEMGGYQMPGRASWYHTRVTIGSSSTSRMPALGEPSQHWRYCRLLRTCLSCKICRRSRRYNKPGVEAPCALCKFPGKGKCKVIYNNRPGALVQKCAPSNTSRFDILQ